MNDRQLLFGTEIEFFNAHIAKRSGGADRLVPAALRVLASSPCIPDGGNGYFFQDGSRVYADCGHVEFATAECCHPADLVAHTKAFERRLAQAAPEIAHRLGGGTVIFARLNVDHLSQSTSFAFHESYLTRYPAPYYANSLVSHLVARVVVIGEGGPAPKTGEFLVSPRMFHFNQVAANETTGNRSRPIFNLREESLSGAGTHRLHVICSATNASQLALYLRGFTALVVRCVELGGESVARHLTLSNPVAALHQVAGDPTCKKQLQLGDGSRLTAVEIQAEYLSIVRKYLDRLPDWAPDVCDRLETVLNALREDPRRMNRTLDWAIKASIYAPRSGGSAVDEGCDIITALYSAARGTAFGNCLPDLNVLLGPSSPVLGTVARLNEELVRRNLRWQDLKLHNNEVLRMAEIDTRFGVLGDGIFDQLDRQGLLKHRVIDEARIDRAMSFPPHGTRAELRGNVVRRLAGKPDMLCTWTDVYDHASRRVLDLSDPWQQTETWNPIPPEQSPTPPGERVAELMRLVEEIT